MRKSLYCPRQWPFWIGIALLWCLAKLPYSWGMKIGRCLGRLAFKYNNKAKHTAIVNLTLCFPELSEQERAQLLMRHFESSGMSIIEAALAWWGNAEKLKPLLTIHGNEYWDNALKQGKGIIFCSGHLMSLELAGRLLALDHPFSVIYRPHKNPVLDKFIRYHRKKIYHNSLERGDLRGMLRCLKKNSSIWFSPDIDAGLRNSIFVPFFNISAATITATARLADMSGAQVLPIFPYRREDYSGYDVYIGKPLDNYPSGDAFADALRVNQLIEEAIRKSPEQYLWQYKRFKTRPEGEKRFYDK